MAGAEWGPEVGRWEEEAGGGVARMEMGERRERPLSLPDPWRSRCRLPARRVLKAKEKCCKGELIFTSWDSVYGKKSGINIRTESGCRDRCCVCPALTLGIQLGKSIHLLALSK